MKRATFSIFAFVLCTFASGCQYYRVRDVSSGKEYITKIMWESGWNGATRFRDLKTDKIVTLQSYEKESISSDAARAEISTGKN